MRATIPTPAIQAGTASTNAPGWGVAIGFGLAGIGIGILATIIYEKVAYCQSCKAPPPGKTPTEPRPASTTQPSETPIRQEQGRGPGSPTPSQSARAVPPAMRPPAPTLPVPAQKTASSNPPPEAKVIKHPASLGKTALEFPGGEEITDDSFPLRLGSTGKRVERLQVWLMRNFGHFGPITGQLDQRTLHRMRKYMQLEAVDQATYERHRMDKPVHQQPFTT